MTWEAGPTGKRGRQPDYSDAAIRTCLTMRVLFGMALGQIAPGNATGPSDHGEEGSPRACCGGSVWIGRCRISARSAAARRHRRRPSPAAGRTAPLPLLVDSTGIRAEGEGEWNARKHGGAKRRGRHDRSDPWRAMAHGARSPSGSTGRRWTSGQPGSPPAGSAMRPYCRVAGPDPARSGDRHRHRRRCLRHPQVP